MRTTAFAAGRNDDPDQHGSLPPRATRSLSVFAMLVGGLLTTVLLGSVAAQDATPSAGQGHGTGHAGGASAAGSPYASRYDPAAPIRSLTPDEIAQIERGEGAGFALPAELNGVPGPRHILDLAAELELSPEQHAQVDAIAGEMRAAVIPAGERYLAALHVLEAAFRSGTMTEMELAEQVAEVAQREGELATAHLWAHLRTAQVLTPEQIAAYNQLRGYESRES